MSRAKKFKNGIEDGATFALCCPESTPNDVAVDAMSTVYRQYKIRPNGHGLPREVYRLIVGELPFLGDPSGGGVVMAKGNCYLPNRDDYGWELRTLGDAESAEFGDVSDGGDVADLSTMG